MAWLSSDPDLDYPEVGKNVVLCGREWRSSPQWFTMLITQIPGSFAVILYGVSATVGIIRNITFML